MLGATNVSPASHQAAPHQYRSNGFLLRQPLPLKHASGCPTRLRAGWTARPRRAYGAVCTPRAAADSAVAEAAVVDSAYGAVAAPPGTAETESPSLDSDVDAATLFDQESNPFPSHTAFETKKPQRRLRNQVQLSCYADSIGSDLPTLRRFMDEKLDGVVAGLHLLPIYPSSGDGGFAPITYQEVDPRLGSWEDVGALADKVDLELELMVNHISPASHEFQDFLAKGDDSEFADMFVDWDAFWPGGDPSEEDLEKIRTRKPERPVLEVTMGDGSTRRVWCTFGAQQIDIDPFSVPGRKFVEDSLASLCRSGAKVVRLDAFGYATKKAGTRCFFEEPDVWELLDRLNTIAKDHGTRLLCEVHEDFQLNVTLAAHGYWVYDFALPLLVLHAFYFKTGDVLRDWLRICPRRQITVLDTHDGMGIDDIAGLASVCHVEELQEVVEHQLGALPNFKYKREDGKYKGFPHQYNATYFSACSESPRAYLLARAIQFWTPGIPMVYYVGLLSGANDHEGIAREGPRGVNRHRYTPEEAAQEMERPVNKALYQLCRFRNQHPAFNGQIGIKYEDPGEEHLLQVTWRNGHHHATLCANLETFAFDVVASAIADADLERTTRFELHDETLSWGRSSLDSLDLVPTDLLLGLRCDLEDHVEEFADPAPSGDSSAGDSSAGDSSDE
jgi:sucrose phosphorylase